MSRNARKTIGNGEEATCTGNVGYSAGHALSYVTISRHAFRADKQHTTCADFLVVPDLSSMTGVGVCSANNDN